MLSAGLAAAAAAVAAPALAQVRRPTVALLGQALITRDLDDRSWAGREALIRALAQSDVRFTDLEVVIRGPRAGAPTRSDPMTVHDADPALIDALARLGINLAATSNNHVFDLGTGGILDTMAALATRGIPFAGTGGDLAAAAAPAFVTTRGGRVALVACATGMVRPGGAATPTRAGVHEIGLGPDGQFEAEGVARMQASIAAARAQADAVIAYQHNHYWEGQNWRTSERQRTFARACIDAGASVFCAHGAPLLHGIEVYKGAPLFHCLGNFIFHTRKAEDHYGPEAWQGVIAECRFEAGRFAGARLVPVQLEPDGPNRGRPALATAAEGRVILDRLAALSDGLGYRLAVRDGAAVIPAG
ncbi:MAG: CapA family protein [Alphaproteobacteria bacterium]|nr:CapA family protein [Alphaproteobacteria bacterium]